MFLWAIENYIWAGTSSNDHITLFIFKDYLIFLTRMLMVKHHYIMVSSGSFHQRNETFFYIEGFVYELNFHN